MTIRVEFTNAERAGVVWLAEQELRPVAEQVRFIVRERLREAGLLPDPAPFVPWKIEDEPIP